MTLYSVRYIKAYQNDNANNQAKVSIKYPYLSDIANIPETHSLSEGR